jgi:hypothetical protein
VIKVVKVAKLKVVEVAKEKPVEAIKAKAERMKVDRTELAGVMELVREMSLCVGMEKESFADDGGIAEVQLGRTTVLPPLLRRQLLCLRPGFGAFSWCWQGCCCW